MAGTAGDEEYSDDDLDALPPDAYEELQEKAYQFTQQAARPVSAAGSLARSGNTETVSSSTHAQLARAREHLSSEYGDLDEEILDLDLEDAVVETVEEPTRRPTAFAHFGESTQREQWRKQRYADGQQIRPSVQHQAFPQVPAAFNGAARHGSGEFDDDGQQGDSEMLLEDPNAEQGGTSAFAQRANSVDALEAQVAKLLQEREALQQEVKTANDNAFAKAGEVAIVRAKLTKASKDYENQVQALQKERATEKTRHNAELVKIKAERERIATDNMFLQHNAGERTNRGVIPPEKRQKGPGGNDTTSNGFSNGSTAHTPKKRMELPFRDGFESHEIMPISPSKSNGRSKPSTPKAGAKRKRKATEDSPSLSLQLSQPRQDSPFRPAQQAQKPTVATNDVQVVHKGAIQKEDKRFNVRTVFLKLVAWAKLLQFYQRVINHRRNLSDKRSVEALSTYTFPSKPDVALSTLLLDGLSSLGTRPKTEDFPAAVCSVVISIWSRCLTETYYKPLYVLVDLVNFILVSSPFTTAPVLMVELVELAQRTADINVVPRWNRHRFVRPPDTRGNIETHPDVNTTECLEILLLVAHDCSQQPEDATRFWRRMRLDFLSVILRTWQPVGDVQLVLKLLCYSVQENSFGTIADVADTGVIQTNPEQHIIDRFTAALVEPPRVIEGEEPYNAVEIAEMRLQALYLIEKMCDKRYCGEALAKSPLAIGRLVRVMNDELNALYDHKYGHEHRAELVNIATRLVFHITSVYASVIDMKQKLNAVPGGAHKYLIVLTRLTLSESVYLERGIEDDVRDCAQQMLENWVSPEESAELQEAFSSARR